MFRIIIPIPTIIHPIPSRPIYNHDDEEEKLKAESRINKIISKNDMPPTLIKIKDTQSINANYIKTIDKQTNGCYYIKQITDTYGVTICPMDTYYQDFTNFYNNNCVNPK